ncbi:MAG: dTDP-4-dehydrorhamnose 3,5-epimerase [Cytophagales bacterium]|nr:dTDP-4-dehydrorhamnose 3,5-epimerase [Cytophagales bacterium]
MQFIETELKGAYIIEIEPHTDERGNFARTFCANEFKQHGLNYNMVQSNLSISLHKHTLRGMHYQINDFQEVKLVRCIKGKIWDVIIDIRPRSETYCQYECVELSENNLKMLYVPEGFAHGFITLEDNCEVAYQVSNFYSPENERAIRWNDPEFSIKWPTNDPILSEKDKNYQDFERLAKN